MSKSKLLLLILSLSLISTLFVACTAADDQTSKARVEITCDEFSSNPHLNQSLEVRAGEIFEVRLCSNPTTGFQWSEDAQISDTTVSKQENHEFIGPESELAPPGTPSQEIWTFKALKQGSSTIYLEYSRPWESGEKGEWTLTVDVTVK
jgi:inhibitor of cysteine peptidase